MARIMKIEPIVKMVLIDDPQTRSDDHILILRVLETFVTPELSLNAVFKNHVTLGIPSLETITRCRRKLQAAFPELRDEKAEKIRAEEEVEFRSYSKEKL